MRKIPHIPHPVLSAGIVLLGVFGLFCSRDWKNPYDDADYNTPPTARVRLSHTAGTVDTLFIADASGSFDAEDSLKYLQFRWDWESDGVWDGDFSPSPVDSHEFSSGGVKAVKLAVIDRGDKGDTVVVTLGINAAPVARFRVTSRLNNFEYSVVVNASASKDTEDDTTALEYRWDFCNGDGWTEPWSSAATMYYTYVIDEAVKGRVHQRTVKLEVRDAGGAVGVADTIITIDFHPGMKLISGGQFTMGSMFEKDTVNNPEAGMGWFAAETLVHEVRVSSFWMDSIEVTQADYEGLMGTNPSYTVEFGNPLMPVERVGWYDAILYCNARSERDGLEAVYTYDGRTEYQVAGIPGSFVILTNVRIDPLAVGYRLPYEAEWAYACRGGNDSRYYFGDDPAQLPAYAWYMDNRGTFPHQVASKLPNAYGLYDMLGNVAEWCNDWFGPYEPVIGGVAVNPVGPEDPKFIMQQPKVLRGGDFETPDFIIRSALRAFDIPRIVDGVNTIVGFRVVLPVR